MLQLSVWLKVRLVCIIAAATYCRLPTFSPPSHMLCPYVLLSTVFSESVPDAPGNDRVAVVAARGLLLCGKRAQLLALPVHLYQGLPPLQLLCHALVPAHKRMQDDIRQ